LGSSSGWKPHALGEFPSREKKRKSGKTRKISEWGKKSTIEKEKESDYIESSPVRPLNSPRAVEKKRSVRKGERPASKRPQPDVNERA